MTELNRYANGKIYMIESASAGLCYYGSTCMPLRKRLHAHKHAYHKQGEITSVIILDQPDYKIVLVEEFPCENKQQLHAREAYYIRNNECVNKVMPNRSRKEYYQENKERISETRKKYYQDNKEHLSETKKKYYQDNKEHLSETRKEYYKKYIKQKEKITCMCGSEYIYTSKSRHEKTKRHQSYISTF
jgi:hypothetical protein